ncbi:MAG TPA: hypothetical protein VMF52_20360 [Steroidobacteraceae bacterium]|nr:hypothetical protein [Steroidobacteraceae bacterium]
MTHAEAFRAAALQEIETRIARFRTLTYDESLALPEADFSDIVITAREVQVTVFRQIAPPSLPDQILLTVQIARHSMGGVVAFRLERGLVYSRNAPPRDATEQELRDSGG